MRLWLEWLRCVRHLRPSCSRSRTFAWLILVLAAWSTRLDRAGVTRFVRILRFDPGAYRRILMRLFSPYLAGSYLVCLADGVKAPKEGRKMPAVRSLHQSADSNSKPPFIMGHSFQAISLLVRSATGHIAAVPLAARIHEGLVWSNRDQRTLLDRLVALFLSLAGLSDRKVLLVADAYYARGKVIRPLLRQGHQLLTRARINTVAYLPPEPEHRRRRGRPRLYGDKVQLRNLLAARDLFHTAPSPIAGEPHTPIRYCWFDLLWRPVGHEVRFVIVKRPQRGVMILMTTDTDLDPLDAIVIYSHRFKIGTGFGQAIRVLGSYAYHFWMEAMDPIRRRSRDQHLHMKSEDYRRGVRRKMRAYHPYVQIGCVAQGLLIHLAVNHGEHVWRQFRSWLRTMDRTRPPSELVVAYSLRDTLSDFLEDDRQDAALIKMLATYATAHEPAALRKVRLELTLM